VDGLVARAPGIAQDGQDGLDGGEPLEGGELASEDQRSGFGEGQRSISEGVGDGAQVNPRVAGQCRERDGAQQVLPNIRFGNQSFHAGTRNSLQGCVKPGSRLRQTARVNSRLALASESGSSKRSGVLGRRARRLAGSGLLLIIVIATTYALTHSGQGAKFQRVPSQGEGRADPLELGWVKSNGSPLPRLDAMSTIGTENPASRSDLLLVNLWASCCAPCTKELPLLAEANDRGNIHVVGVSRDVYLDRAQHAMAAAGVDYPNYSDAKGHFADSLHGLVPPNLLPMTLLVVNNRIEWIHIGPFGSISDIAKASSLVR